MSAGEPDATQGFPALPAVVPGGDARPSIEDELEAAGLDDIAEIGRGGFGVVYEARQPALDRTVAVKVLHADLDDESRERFLREEHAMGRLSGHPNIVDVLQVDVTVSGRPFLVMPFHARGSFEDLVRDEGPLDWEAAFRVGVKLCGALESAHRAGILHRDVKPGNMLLTAYGEPQLTDFGIARVPGSFETSDGLLTGSPAFTAPEVIKGFEPTPASDVYGLGATLFMLITGHAAFERRSGEKIVAQFLRVTTQPVPDLRDQDIPDDVAAAIEAAMAAEPDERPATATEFAAVLQSVQVAHGFAPDQMALLGADPAPRTGPPAKRRSQARRSPTLPPTTAAKFRPPTPASAPIERTRLLGLLRAGNRKRLAVIHAQAGFGKSTLVAQWRDLLVADGVAVAWLGADVDDDVDSFVAHLLEAIRRVRPDLAHVEELPALVDEVHASGEAVVVVVDDWHRVTDQDAHRAMDFLLDKGCHHLRFVVTSRAQTGLPLSRMRVRDELVEIDADALRLTEAETNAFLATRGANLSADLRAAVDGWPAALQLVTVAQRAGTDRATLVDDYLAENVFDALPPQLADFLMSISVVDAVNAGLASTLSGESDGEHMLHQAVRRDLFLHHTDDPHWFRFQRLFAEFLRRRLDRAHPGRSRSLHAKASTWFGTHQMIRESVDHAMAATDVRSAVDLVESTGTASLLGIAKPARKTFGKLTGLLAGSKADESRERVHRLCFAGIAAREQLEIDAAVNLYRDALDAGRAQVHWPARYLLAELRFYQGKLAAAGELMDATSAVGTADAPVDFLIARCCTAARIDAALGRRSAARARLDEAAEYRIDRLAAHVAHERIRLGFTDVAAESLSGDVGEMARIRALLAEHRIGSDDDAVRRARNLLASIDEHDRRRAFLEARLLLADALAAAGWQDESTAVRAAVDARLTAVGLETI